jgi:predicted phosphoribosyltransferase
VHPTHPFRALEDRFADRRDAGRRLGELLRARGAPTGSVVLALPRGGVPVGHEIAQALGAPLDVLVVRKLGVPWHEELAMGAIARGVRVLNDDVLLAAHVGRAELEEVTLREQAELERRERAYRGGRPPVDVTDAHVVVVDDGLATGATMRAAVSALRRLSPASITVAVPVGSAESLDEIGALADDVVFVHAPRWFRSVGEWYADFRPTTDAEVRALLDARPHAPPLPYAANARPEPGRIARHVDPAVALVRTHARPLAGARA